MGHRHLPPAGAPRGLYSVPGELIGQRVQVRADSHLVKVFSRGQLIKTHPRVKTTLFPGRRPTTQTRRCLWVSAEQSADPFGEGGHVDNVGGVDLDDRADTEVTVELFA